MRRLLSVHVPKAGGTSTLEILRQAYGDGFRVSYEHDPADPVGERQLDPSRHFERRLTLGGDSCVHGHFHPGVFAIEDDVVLATILRHPVDNLLSVHAFWRTLSGGRHALHDHFLENDLTVLQMARLPILQRLYSGTYFGGFDMGRFDVIGDHADRGSFFDRLSALTGATLDGSIRKNETPPRAERASITPGSEGWRELESALADDVRFFERHAT